MPRSFNMLNIEIINKRTSWMIAADPSNTLSRNLFVHGCYRSTPLCAGMGICGRCALLFHSSPPPPSDKDIKYFSKDFLDKGFRLGCSHYPESGQSFELVAQEVPDTFIPVSNQVPDCLGIDIGTTSLKWGLGYANGKVSKGEMINPQMGAGPDIMSRMSFSMENSENHKLLCRILVEWLDNATACQAAPEGRICVTGNPAMIYYLLERDISGLAAAPYHLDYSGGTVETPGRSGVYIPSLLSPFAGADISAGLFWVTEKVRPEYPFLLADFGTNGELVLALSPEKYLVTSVALGPALEGVGLRYGSPYREGVASGFDLDSQGIVSRDSWHTSRVSGSGYISLLSHLVRLKLVSESGNFTGAQNPIARNISISISNGCLTIGNHFTLDGRDIEEILKVKAAFTLGLSCVCEQGDVSLDKLKAIYIAGSLGRHTRPADLETLGFFPPGSSNKCLVLGNTSLKGALLLAANDDLRSREVTLARHIKPVNLGEEHGYVSSRLAKHMIFKYPG